jgi:protocatechuate 3,4-dioxygenase alpha subunit
MSLEETPSQTAGPFVHIGLLPQGLAPLTTAVSAPEIVLEGQILDGTGEPVRDALVELWDASTGQWLRSATDTGVYRFELRRPQAAYVSLHLLARGINVGLQTRAYLQPAPGDTLLGALGERAATLMASPMDGGWRFDIRLQGAAETAFLAL